MHRCAKSLARLPDALVDVLGEERVRELADHNPERISELVRDAVVGATREGGHELAATLKKHGPEMLARRRAERRGFEERLARRWAIPFAPTEMAMVVAYELGEQFTTDTKRRQFEELPRAPDRPTASSA